MRNIATMLVNVNSVKKKPHKPHKLYPFSIDIISNNQLFDKYAAEEMLERIKEAGWLKDIN